MLNVIKKSAIEGTPRANSQAIRAKVPSVFWSFNNTWENVFINGISDHKIKELCRVYVSQSVDCKYCGNQRSIKSLKEGVKEENFSELLNFEKSNSGYFIGFTMGQKCFNRTLNIHNNLGKTGFEPKKRFKSHNVN